MVRGCALIDSKLDTAKICSDGRVHVDHAQLPVVLGEKNVFTRPGAMIPLLNRGGLMKGFVQGADRQQTTLLPECLDDWVDESNPVRAVDVFVDALELGDLGFDGVDPAATG